jgi:hypothetical protein
MGVTIHILSDRRPPISSFPIAAVPLFPRSGFVQCYPNYKTVHRRFQAWCRSEVLRGVLTDIANELRERGALDEEECFIDATFAMAKGGGAEVAPTKRGKGMKIMAMWIDTACRSRSARMRRTIMRCASFNYASIST